MIIQYPNQILTTPLEEFDFTNQQNDPVKISDLLMSVLHQNNLIGISANQIGMSHRVFAMRGADNYIVCFNPKIVHYSDELELLDEACPSFPGVDVKIKRPKEIRVRFQTPTGVVVTQKYSGLTARTFQHEIDHLDGFLFYNRANRYHREKGLKNGRVGRRKN